MARKFRRRPIHKPTTSRKGAGLVGRPGVRHADIKLYRRLIHELDPHFQRRRVVAAQNAGQPILRLSDREVEAHVGTMLAHDPTGACAQRLEELRAIASGEAVRLALGLERRPTFVGLHSTFGRRY